MSSISEDKNSENDYNIFDQLVDFLVRYYPDYELESYTDSKKELFRLKTIDKVIFSSSKISEVKDFLLKEFSFREDFLTNTNIQIFSLYLNFVKGIKVSQVFNPFKYTYSLKYLATNTEKIMSYQEVIKEAYEQGFSLDKLIPYICPHCNHLMFSSQDIENGIIYTCNYCKYKKIDLL